MLVYSLGGYCARNNCADDISHARVIGHGMKDILEEKKDVGMPMTNGQAR